MAVDAVADAGNFAVAVDDNIEVEEEDSFVVGVALNCVVDDAVVDRNAEYDFPEGNNVDLDSLVFDSFSFFPLTLILLWVVESDTVVFSLTLVLVLVL